MNQPAGEFVQRHLIWEALSELFLDTQLQPHEHEWIAEVLAQSPYTEDELEWILRHEVAPLLGINLLNIAGEWTGFNPDWIEHQILQGRKKWVSWLSGLTGIRMVRKEWQLILNLVAAHRSKAKHDAN